MIIYYLANIRFPTEKAHGVQVAKMCESFANMGHSVELVIPIRKNDISTDPFEYYSIHGNFRIKKTFSLDLIFLGRIGFLIQSITFSISSFIYLVSKKADIIYSRDDIPLYVVGLLNIKRVYEAHTPRFNFFTKKVLKNVERIISISGGLKDFYVSNGIDEEKIMVAHDAASLTDSKEKISKNEIRKKLGITLDKKVALYIGRVDTWKGVKTLFEASRALEEKNIVTVIIGGEEKQIEILRKEYPNVQFLGYKPYKEVFQNQQAGDVLVLPNTGKDDISCFYTSPLKLFTYMSSGIPIVASDLPSIREVLNEDSVIFFEPDNSDSLTKAIIETLQDKNHSLDLAMKAKEEVLNYTWKGRVEKIISFIQSQTIL